MASIKLKFRPSSVKGKKGVLNYQIIHYRLTRLIKTSYQIMPFEWDDSTGSLLIPTQSECKARLLLIRDHTNWEMTRLQGIINDLERTGVEYTIDDIVAFFRKIPLWRVCSNSCNGVSINWSGRKGDGRQKVIPRQ